MYANPEESVESLRLRVQRALGVGSGRLLNSTGGILDNGILVKKARLRNGDSLTLQIRTVCWPRDDTHLPCPLLKS